MLVLIKLLKDWNFYKKTAVFCTKFIRCIDLIHQSYCQRCLTVKIKEQTRKLIPDSSKHYFEVVDKADEVSSKYCFEVVDKADKVSSKHYFEVVDKTDEDSSKHCFEVMDKADKVSNLSMVRQC